VDRGETFELCLDYDCGSLLDAVQDRFDGEWDCPACDGDLEIVRRRSLLASCERYPDCETWFAVPNGTVVGECDCGLPRFETASGERCLDSDCGGA
jgi:DNA topoisomerase-1